MGFLVYHKLFTTGLVFAPKKCLFCRTTRESQILKLDLTNCNNGSINDKLEPNK